MKWTADREIAYVRAWNDGVEPELLRERFGVTELWRITQRLRRRGYVLKDRLHTGDIRRRRSPA